MKNPQPAVPKKLSVVIPCYNEVNRIPILVDGIQELVRKAGIPVEVLVVNDGSTDDTLHLLRNEPNLKRLVEEFTVRVIDLGMNQGKGGAIRAGVLEASGTHILTMDADMATPPLSFKEWKGDIWKGEVTIHIASRGIGGSQVEDAPMRKVAGRIFNLFVRLFTPLRVKDSQCGYKFYPAPVGKALFENLKVRGWAHDVEVLTKFQYAGGAIKEQPVRWQAQEESKVSLVRDSIRMFFGVLRIGISNWFNHFITGPLRSLKGRPQPIALQHSAAKEPAIFRFLFVLTALAIMVLMPSVSGDYGITGDEWIQNDYGKQVHDYFAKGDTKAIEFESQREGFGPIIYYSGGYELLNTLVYRSLGTDEWETRHFINAFVGFLAILFCGLLAKQFAGWRAGLFAMLVLLVTPRIFGHAMNNSKDIPFAAAYIISLYYMFRIWKEMPRPSIRSLIMACFGIAFTLNVRVGGLLLLPYLAMFVGGPLLVRKNLRVRFWKLLPRTIGMFAIVAGVAYALGVLFWPWALLNPLSNPVEALGIMSNYVTEIRILFNGDYIISSQVPWYYIPMWMGVTFPIVSLLGIAIGLLLPLLTKRYRNLNMALLAFVVIFPLAYAVYQGSNLYDGMRHFLFLIPPLVVVAALGWDYVIQALRGRKALIASYAVLAILLFLPARWMVANHPHQVVYFNEIFGGVDKALGQFETDYWYNSVKTATRQLIEKENLHEWTDTVVVVTNASFEVQEYFKQAGIPARGPYARYQAEDNWIGYDAQRNREEKRFTDWDYAIFVTRYVDGEELRNHWPPLGTYFSVDADKTALTVVIKRKSKADIDANLAFQRRDWSLAADGFRAYLVEDQQSARVWYFYGLAMINSGLPNEAADAFAQSLQLRPVPSDPQIFGMYGNALVNAGRADEAIQFATEKVRYYEFQMNQFQLELRGRTQVDQPTMSKYMNFLFVLSELHQTLAIAYNQLGDAASAQQHAQQRQQYLDALNQYR